MIVVMGATGNVGKKLSRLLLEAGQRVRVVARRAEALKELARAGADPRPGDLSDAEFLRKALDGAQAAFTLIPPDPRAADFPARQDRIAASIAEALAATRPSHVVNLSSQGAHLSEGTGPIAGLHRMEKRLDALEGVNVLHLRATYFMENLLAGLTTAKAMGMFAASLDGDLAFPMVATEDIARHAARRLTERDFEGKSVQDLLGQRDVSMNEVAAILRRELGIQELEYVRFSEEEYLRALMSWGISPSVAQGFVEMERAINGGLMRSTPRVPANTGETSVEAFLERSFVPAYAAQE